MNKHANFLVAALGFVLLTGCDEPEVRAMNASPDSTALEFVVGGESLHSGVTFGNITDFRAANSDRGVFDGGSSDENFSFEVRADLGDGNGVQTIAGPNDRNLNTDSRTIVVAVNDVAQLNLEFLDAGSSDNLRFLHAAPDAGDVDIDVFLTNNTGTTTSFADINYRQDMTLLSSGSGTYRIRITDDSGGERESDPFNLDDEDERIAVLLEDTTNSPPVRILLIDGNDEGINETILE